MIKNHVGTDTSSNARQLLSHDRRQTVDINYKKKPSKEKQVWHSVFVQSVYRKQCCSAVTCSKVFNMFNIGSETSEPMGAERNVSRGKNVQYARYVPSGKEVGVIGCKKHNYCNTGCYSIQTDVQHIPAKCSMIGLHIFPNTRFQGSLSVELEAPCSR